MFSFIVKRFLSAVSVRRIWLLAGFIPPLIYLLYYAYVPDHFDVFQDISISAQAPFALSTSPDGYIELAEAVADSDDFFLNRFALTGLSRKLYHSSSAVPAGDDVPQIPGELVQKRMTLGIPGEKTLRICYSGQDLQRGVALVEYYSERFVRKAEEGIKRHTYQQLKNRLAYKTIVITEERIKRAYEASDGILGKGLEESESDVAATQEAQEEKAAFETIEMIGGIRINKAAVLWRADRLFPILLIFICSLMAVLFWIGFLEVCDQSLKSERQVARYLGLPTLGAVPDLNTISRAIGL